MSTSSSQPSPSNVQIFSQQITAIRDRAEMRAILKALTDARNLYNLIRSSGQYDLLEKLDFRKLARLATEADNHLALLNQREALENEHDNSNLLNIALEDVLFTFRKVSEAEMVIADELKDTLRRTREGLAGNFDPRDPEFITLREELERLFRKKNLSAITNAQILTNPAYTEAMMLSLIVGQFMTFHHLPLTAESSRFINSLVMQEYLAEFNGQQPA